MHITLLDTSMAHNIGANTVQIPHSDDDRMQFEAWMRGHCWKVSGAWNGHQYVHAVEKDGGLNAQAMLTRQLWAAWRDSAAVARAIAAPFKPEKD